MGLTIVNSLDIEIWREFVERHPQGNIFHTPEMFQVFAKVKGYRPALWATMDNHNQVLALLLPVNISLNEGLLRKLTSRAVVYGSILCAPGSEGREGLKFLLQAYRRKMQGRILFTELRNLSDLSDLQPILNESEFSFEEYMNFLINLDQSEDILWQKISKSGRQSVRTSNNKGTIIEEVTDRRQLLVAYQLLKNVYARVQVPLTHFSLFEAAYDILAPLEMFKIFLARVGEKYISTCFILMYKGIIIDWYAGSDRTFASSSAGELIIWRILQWGKENGFHKFDFGGGGKLSEEYGPRTFKAKFGGNTVYYGRNFCIHSPLSFQVSKHIYYWFRRWRLVRSLDPNQQQNIEYP
jgi:hypothetical protein